MLKPYCVPRAAKKDEKVMLEKEPARKTEEEWKEEEEWEEEPEEWEEEEEEK
jgi:hypothetical protein